MHGYGLLTSPKNLSQQREQLCSAHSWVLSAYAPSVFTQLLTLLESEEEKPALARLEVFYADLVQQFNYFISFK